MLFSLYVFIFFDNFVRMQISHFAGFYLYGAAQTVSIIAMNNMFIFISPTGRRVKVLCESQRVCTMQQYRSINYGTNDVDSHIIYPTSMTPRHADRPRRCVQCSGRYECERFYETIGDAPQQSMQWQPALAKRNRVYKTVRKGT